MTFAARYFKGFIAGWGTMDFNSHMANTAYLNLAADVRMAFFADHGFPPGFGYSEADGYSLGTHRLCPLSCRFRLRGGPADWFGNGGEATELIMKGQ